MRIGRRQTVTLGAAAMGAMVLTPMARAQAQPVPVADLIARATGGVVPVPGDLVLTAPDVAENGQSVTVELSCPGALEMRLIAPANPLPEVCTLHLPPQGGVARVVTRIRLADTQELIALARMTDGTWRQASAAVIVETAGCVG